MEGLILWERRRSQLGDARDNADALAPYTVLCVALPLLLLWVAACVVSRRRAV